MTKPHNEHTRLATVTQDRNATRVRKGNKPKLSQVMNAGSQADKQNKSTWEASTLTGVSRKQREKNMPNSSTCCRLNTDHNDVAMVTEVKPHPDTPKNPLKKFQRCLSFSSDACSTAFLMSQKLAFASLSSLLQLLGGRADLLRSRMQQLPQKFNMSSFLAFGKNICRYRCAFNLLETHFAAG